MPIPDVGSVPATGKARVSSVRDWSDDDDDDCRILEVYDPLPVAFAYPVPSPPADADDQVLEVEPLAVGPKGATRKRPAAASSAAGTSSAAGPTKKKQRTKTMMKRRERPVTKE